VQGAPPLPRQFAQSPWSSPPCCPNCVQLRSLISDAFDGVRDRSVEHLRDRVNGRMQMYGWSTRRPRPTAGADLADDGVDPSVAPASGSRARTISSSAAASQASPNYDVPLSHLRLSWTGECMTKFSKAEISRAVIEARHYLARSSPPAKRRKTLAAERTAERLSTRWLRSSGLDVKAMFAVEEQRRLEWDRGLLKREADASRRWAQRIKVARANVATLAQSLQSAAADLLPRGSLNLEEPASIIASDPRILKSRQFVPFNSSAKVLVDRRAGSVDKVSFVYLFRNQSSRAILFDFHAPLSASGHVALRQKGHFSGGFGTAEVAAAIEVLPSPTIQDPQRLAFVPCSAGGPPFWWVDHTEEETFSDGTLLSATVLVEARAIVAILVSLIVSSDFDGRLVVDMNTGNFDVRAPVVVVVPRE
jgi:hypothetical protein